MVDLEALSKALQEERDILFAYLFGSVAVYSIFKTGKLLFSRDEKRRISFLVKNLKEYWDLEITCRPIYRAMKKRIEEGKFGLRGSN